MKSFKNKKALHDYFVVQKLEAGVVLKGTEIKSIRDGKLNFKDSFARIDNGECWLFNFHISPWENASFFNHQAERKRKLLLHASEIKRLKSKVEEQGMTLVPLELYINDKGLCKVVLALVKGKKLHDKRDSIQARDLERERDREGKT